MTAGSSGKGQSELTYSDRQYLTVDRTGGKYNGRVYVNGNNRVPYGISDFVVFRSTDNGITFQGPGTRENFGKHSAGNMGNAVVLSDGSLTGVFEEKGVLRAIRSVDGGASLLPAVDIDTGYTETGNRKGANNNVVGLPIVAVDESRGPRRDNLYVVWGDRRTGQGRIFFASSADKGVTWSVSRPIDDPPRGKSMDNFMPTIAVNRDGVIGIMWYDRRQHSDNLGWDARFTASVDGGKSFLPSVKVSEVGTTFGDKAKYSTLRTNSTQRDEKAGGGVSVDVSLSNFTFLGGDTSGMAADATGVFHPVWIDNRTGTPQVWTAAVRIGAGGESADVSARVTLDVINATFDRGSGIIEATVQLRNTSPQTVAGPFRVSIREATSDVGDVRITGNDWTFGDQSLPPGGRSSPRKWKFELVDIRPFRRDNRYLLGLLKLDARILVAPKPASAGNP